MAFDFKKEYKEFYLPKRVPEIVDIPCMNYAAVRGSGRNFQGITEEPKAGDPPLWQNKILRSR